MTPSHSPPGISFQCFVPNTNVTVVRIIAGYQQIIAQVRAKGLKILGGTLTPLKGAFYLLQDSQAPAAAA